MRCTRCGDVIGPRGFCAHSPSECNCSLMEVSCDPGISIAKIQAFLDDLDKVIRMNQNLPGVDTGRIWKVVAYKECYDALTKRLDDEKKGISVP